MKKTFGLLLALLIPTAVAAQGINVPPRFLVEMPNASTLPSASFDVDMRFFPQGGVLVGFNVGLHDRLMVGASFGGTNVIGQGDIDFHPYAGANVRYRLVAESFTLPGVAIGFNSQGHGAYVDSTSRFERKAQGVFAVSSKNYQILDGLNIHLGGNYSLQNDDRDKSINLFTGAGLNLKTDLAVMVEYDFALNDDGGQSLGSGKGYLNAGLRYTIKDAVYFELFFIDLFENFENNFQRAIKITYLEFFNL